MSGNGISRVDDGEIVGIEGWDIHATINCEPNSGPNGTPFTVTIYYDRGAEKVTDMETWQAIESWGWDFKRTPDVDPEKKDERTWTTMYGVYLTGSAGILRFYAIEDEIQIAYGDIDVNGGRRGLRTDPEIFFQHGGLKEHSEDPVMYYY